MTEDVVGVLVPGAGKDTLLVGALVAGETGLLDVDDCVAFGVLGGVDVEGDGHHANGLADEPANTLKGEDGVEGVGLLLVLRRVSIHTFTCGDVKLTMAKMPLSS